MTSTKSQGTPPASPAWKSEGLSYFSYNFHLRRKFGHRVQKVSIDAGFTCPNVDGTVTTGGCTFCDNRSFSPSRRVRRDLIAGQIDEGIRRLKMRYQCDHFLAYFQPATNTYAPVDRLRKLYLEALSHEKIVGLAIGTRPDCVPDDVLDLLGRLAQDTYLTLELGIQTIHEQSLAEMNRGHGYAVFPDAVHRCRGRGFEVSTHVILGLPGETKQEMLQTARAMSDLQLDSIKIHNLYVVKNTPLADQLKRGELVLLERDEYVDVLVDFLERLPPDMVVERISGDAPGDYFLGPSWCLDKPAVLRAVEAEFSRRGTCQASRWEPAKKNKLSERGYKPGSVPRERR